MKKTMKVATHKTVFNEVEVEFPIYSMHIISDDATGYRMWREDGFFVDITENIIGRSYEIEIEYIGHKIPHVEKFPRNADYYLGLGDHAGSKEDFDGAFGRLMAEVNGVYPDVKPEGEVK